MTRTINGAPPMKIKRDYLSFAELAERWKLPADSLDLRRAVMSGLVKPAIIVRAALPRVAMQHDVPVPVLDHHELPVLEDVQGWCFPVCAVQTGPFEALFPVVASVPNPTEADGLYALAEPISLTALLADAVVMLDDVESAEAASVGTRELSTKEENTALKLLSVLAADGYGWHASGRSDTVKTVALAAEAMGLAISANTVLRFLRRAQSEFPPSADYFRAQAVTEIGGEGESGAVGQGERPAMPDGRSSIEIGESQLSCEAV